MQLPSPGFELGATSPFPKTLTITPRASNNPEKSQIVPHSLQFFWNFFPDVGYVNIRQYSKFELPITKIGGVMSIMSVK